MTKISVHALCNELQMMSVPRTCQAFEACVYYIREWKELDSNNLSPKSGESDHDALQSGAYWCACKRGI